MNNQLFAGLATCLALVCRVSAESIPLGIDFGRGHHVELKDVGGGEVEVTTTGDDPFLILEVPDRPAESAGVLAFEYFCPEGVEGVQVYFGSPAAEERRLEAGSLGRAESWLPHAVDLGALSGGRWSVTDALRLDLGRKAGVVLRIRNLHLREPNAAELRSEEERQKERKGKLESAARIDGFRAAGFPGRLDEVAVGADELVITGDAPGDGVRLIEIRPWVTAADTTVADGMVMLGRQAGVSEAGEVDGGRFSVQVAREDGSPDRITSRWALAKPLAGGGWRLLSRWRYATDLSGAARHDLDRKIPRSVKGMGGVPAGPPLEELVELGVDNITININLSSLFDVGGGTGVSFESGGRSWSVRPGGLRDIDRVAKFATDQGMVVSAILLVGFSDGSYGRMLNHPEADRAGHYAMPDMGSAEGVAAYQAAIGFLSERYARPGDPHGRISNWIVHNEVNFGWEWTNMGPQPAAVYADHYLRSMRLVHDLTRRDNPHSRVFMSLTHHWNVPDAVDWKSYSVRGLIGRLAASSRDEGDFAWGLAYHPYPENLREPDAWNDTRVADDFDTPLITPKNVMVLERWMQRAEMLYRGEEPRAVLFSEQGFNTPDYGERSLREQAAGFVYMWRQMRGMTTLEAFHNHRWVDHPREGGLLLGLRKLPADGKRYGGKKPAWEVYRALGTPREAEVTAFADEIIGAGPEREGVTK